MIIYNNNFASLRWQKGVGLLEVLIALLLLGIAVLGYAALQGVSLKATDESLTRTQAISLLREATERIRTNALGSTYSLTVKSNAANIQNIDTVLTQYKNDFALASPPTAITCPDTGCTPIQMATNDVVDLSSSADTYGINLGMSICPGTDSAEKSYCLIAAWNNTTATKGESNTDCFNNSGAYRLGADCIYMEAY